MADINIPGKPSSVDPELHNPEDQPTRPEQDAPSPGKADQSAPAVRSATGQQVGSDEDSPRAQADMYLTTSQGARVRDTHRSLKAGERGPTLLQDHHLREKITSRLKPSVQHP
ncbi:MAG: catalase [Micrococcaceae bacterium]|nr:catalase [Micrococcaceae bacterium]